MDTRHGEKLPGHLRDLAELGRTGDLNMRPVLFRVVCDLFALKQQHSRDELLQFEAMALPMMTGIEDSLLEPVAARLAEHHETPPAVLDYLMGRSERIAAQVFANAPAVERGLLLDAALFGPAAVAAAIAGRRRLDLDMVRFLAERSEEAVVLALLGNGDAKFSAASQGVLIRRALHSAALAAAVARRDDFGGDMAGLFLHAPPSRRAAILLAARRQDPGGTDGDGGTATEASALQRLERLAMARDWQTFATTLASVLACAPGQAEALARDLSGEPMALALAMAGMDADAAARIFMCMDPAISHSVDKVRWLVEMVVATPRRTAGRLVRAMLGLPSKQTRPQAGDLRERIAREWPGRPQTQGEGVTPPLPQA